MIKNDKLKDGYCGRVQLSWNSTTPRKVPKQFFLVLIVITLHKVCKKLLSCHQEAYVIEMEAVNKMFILCCFPSYDFLK